MAGQSEIAVATRKPGFGGWVRDKKNKIFSRGRPARKDVGASIVAKEPSTSRPQSSANPHPDFWDNITNKFRDEIGPETYEQLTKSISTLRGSLQNFQGQSDQEQASNFAGRIKKVADSADAINGVASILAPFHPELGSLIRGGILLAADLANNSETYLGMVLQRLEEISFAFPKFESYLKIVGHTESLKDSIQAYIVETIAFCGKAISFLNQPRYLFPSIAEVETEYNRVMERIRRAFQRFRENANDEIIQRLFEGPSKSDPKKIVNIPYPENPYFSGHQAYLQAIEQALCSGNDQGDNDNRGSILLYGLGGVGKTELALQFANQNMDKFEYIFWFSADTAEKVDITVAETLGMILPRNTNVSSGNARSVFQSWLLENDNWLLIFDNVESHELLYKIWPRKFNGSVIVTSRYPDVGNRLTKTVQEVIKLPETDGVAMIKSLIPEGYASGGYESAKRLHEVCDGLPLALSLVASFIRERQSPIDEALDIFSAPKDLLGIEGSVDHKDENLRRIWDANISQISTHSWQLLLIMSLLDPDHIPEDMLKASIGHQYAEAFAKDLNCFLDSLRGLLLHSFIRRNEQRISVHRLLQEAVLDRADTPAKQHAFQVATQIVRNVFPQQSKEGLLMSPSWDKCARYFSHIEALDRRCRELELFLARPLEYAELLYYCSWYFYERGSFGRAFKLASTVKEICTKTGDESRLLLADSLTTIGGIDVEECRNEDAYSSLSRALELRLGAVKDGLMDADHPQIANSYMSLAASTVGCGRVEEAIQLNLRSVEIRQVNPSSQLQMLSMSYHNLAISYLTAGKLDEALAAIRRSRDVAQGCYGALDENHVAAMETRITYCLGNIYLALGQIKNALHEHQKALSLRIKIFGASHHNTACSQYKLGAIAEDGTNYVRAWNFYNQSIVTLENDSRFSILLARSLLCAGTVHAKMQSHDSETGANLIKRASHLFKERTGQPLPESDGFGAIKKWINPFLW